MTTSTETSSTGNAGLLEIEIFGREIILCKYGENGWQTPATLFSCETDDPLAIEKFRVIEGTAPSYNNFCDLDRLLQTMTHVVAGYVAKGRTVPHIALGAKHGNCCGAYVSDAPIERVQKMMSGDPLAIFGGLVMTNFEISDGDAEELSVTKLDGIIAPWFSPGVFKKLERKHGKCRFIQNEALASLSINSLDIAPRIRYVRGGLLRQPNYTFVLDWKDPDIQCYGEASTQQRSDLLLAWAIGSTSNSNTITLVKNNMLIGNGVGQQDRVGAAKLAIERATRSEHSIEGSVAYSDSFFPKPDGVEFLINAGVKAIFTSSGSQNDHLTVELCQKHNVTLCMIPDAKGRGFCAH